MESKDRKKFFERLVVLASICDRTMQETQLAAYFEALRDLSFEDFEKATGILIKTWQYPGKLPTPAQFREAIEGNLTEQAESAFQVCLQHSRFDDSVRFQDQAIMVAIERMGGWEQWCEFCRWMPDEDFHWKKKEWIEHYISAKRLNLKPTQEQFVGYVERQSQLHDGYQFIPYMILSDGSVDRELEEKDLKRLTE